jgi:hypothetical protein
MGVKQRPRGRLRPHERADMEGDVDFNPDDAQQYLEGVEYPASKEEISSAAEENGAPEDLVGLIGSLPRPEFSSQEELMDELRARPSAG